MCYFFPRQQVEIPHAAMSYCFNRIPPAISSFLFIKVRSIMPLPPHELIYTSFISAGSDSGVHSSPEKRGEKWCWIEYIARYIYLSLSFHPSHCTEDVFPYKHSAAVHPCRMELLGFIDRTPPGNGMLHVARSNHLLRYTPGT